MDKTIAAVSTPFGSGGIAVIRISGSDAFSICEKVFISKQKISDVKSHSFIYGKICDGEKVIDSGLCAVFKAPNSFTGENVVEINCHGGIKITSMVLEACLNAGAVLAEKGEFSKRAFINGKMDLSEAEAVIDLINAKTENSVLLAAGQLEGRVSTKINVIRDSLCGINAKILAVIDFPDEEIDEYQREDFLSVLSNKQAEIRNLADSFSVGKIYRNGLAVLLLGKTNAGKSSLLNSIIKENRAIVTDIAGTTRDVIEEFVDIKGVPVNLLDTAGIRETEDIVENIGVEKTKELINTADIIVCVTDGSRPKDKDDDEIFELIADKKVIYVKNKADLDNKFEENRDFINISCKTGEGIDLLCDEIYKRADVFSPDETLINNARHKACLEKAFQHIEDAKNGFNMGLPADIVSIDIESACMELGAISGISVSQDTVNHIFADFCVGK